jgi:hypothetical protein
MRFICLAVGVVALATGCSGTSGGSSGSTGGSNGTTGSSGSTGGTTGGGQGSGTLTGPEAFTVASAAASASISQCGTCGKLADGTLDSVGVVLSDQIITGLVCSNDGGAGTATSHVLQIQVAAANYVSCANGNVTSNFPVALTANSSYPILNEDVDDEDLCGNIPAADVQALSIVTSSTCQGLSGTCSSQAWAQSGSVTIDSLSSTSVTGHFSVVMGDANGAADGGALSGTFTAPLCN